MSAKPFSILFIAPLDPSDAIAASGLIKRLHDEIPGARFTIVTSAAAAPLFAAVPNLKEVVVVKAMSGFFAQFALWRKARPTRWKLIVDVVGTGIARWLRRERRAEPKAAFAGEHRVIAAARLLGMEDDPPAPYLFTTPEIEADADAALTGEGPILAVGPGASWSGRVWPAERFGQVSAQLLQADKGPLAGGRIAAFGGEGDREVLLTAKFPLPRHRIVLRPYDQGYLEAYAWLKRCRLYIGVDNVWTQLAAAAGAPTLALFGPSDEATSAPYGPRARVVRGPRTFEAFKAIDPLLNQQIGHMNDLQTDTVLAAARDLLKATEGRKP